MHPKLFLSALTSGWGMFIFGYHLNELSSLSELFSTCSRSNYSAAPTFASLPPCINMSKLQYSFAVAVVALGGGMGAWVTGPLCNRLGRKRTMLLFNVFHLLGPLLMTFAPNYTTLVFGRLFAGIGAGACTVVTPMYLAEIAPAAYRGYFGILSAVELATGIAIASLLGFYLSSPPYWRIIVAFSMLISLLQIVGLLTVTVESPVYLLSRGDKGVSKAKDLTREIWQGDEIPAPQSSGSGASAGNTTLREFVTLPEYRYALLNLLLLHSAQQLTGINTYFAYSFDILIQVLKSANATSVFFLIISFYYIIATAGCGLVVDRFGRRPLLFASMIGMAIAPALFVIGDRAGVPALCLVAFVVAVTLFALGLSGIPFMITAELVEPRTIGAACQVSLLVNWMSNFIILFAFPPLLERAGSYMFLFFCAYALMALVVGFRLIPETKGRSSSDVFAELKARALGR
ncbi:Bifunctional purine biosynthesis protein PurH [Sorochytrium milnesiophthora]